MKTQILPIRISVNIFAGLFFITFGMQFTAISNPFLPNQVEMTPPDPHAMIATANDVASELGWSESPSIDTYQGQEYVTLRHNQSSGNCSFSSFVVIGEWELSSRARNGISTLNFHGYEASRNQAADGTLDSLWWQARVELYAEVSSYDCPPVDVLPLAEALYAAAARNRLFEEASQPTQSSGPSTTEATLSVSVENNYTAIASDGESELLIQAAVTGPVSGEDVYWSATKLDSGEDLTPQLSPYAADAHNSLMLYKPSEIYDQPFIVEIQATIFTAQDEISDSVQISVVRPPVILIHGIWSDSSAMLPVEQAISFSDSMFGTRVSRVDYSSPSSYGDMTQKVDVLGAEVANALASLNNRGTKVGRVDIVAHSMGGLITRLYLVNNASYVRKLITLATPHLGTPFANWYHDLIENGLQSCPGGIGPYTPQLPTQDELEWFLKLLRDNKGLRTDALQYGEAVKQLQTIDTDTSVPHLLSYSQPGSVDYYFLAGDQPFIYAMTASPLASYVESQYPYAQNNPGDCSQTALSPGLETMIDEFFANISAAGTDGVVPLDSARGQGLSSSQVATVHATHFSIVKNPQAIDAVLRYLTNQEIGLSGTLINTNSPGHLHVYDERGDHVGLDAYGNVEIDIMGASYQAYSTATGDHESIWIPPDVEGIWFEFAADEEGIVGLEIGQGMQDGLHFFSYEELEVQPGSTVVIQVDPTNPEGQITHPDGQTLSLSPTFSEIGYESDGTVYSPDEPGTFSGSKLKISNIVLICVCLQGWALVVAGVVGVIVLRRRQPDNKNPLVILGVVIVMLTIATCSLGAFLIFGGPSDYTTSQPTAPISSSPRLESATAFPTALSISTPEIMQTSMAELTLINDTSNVICYVFITPIESEDWGDDWLGSDELLSPGDSHTFQIPNGTYHLAALDCGDQILAEEYDVDISGMMEWTIQE